METKRTFISNQLACMLEPTVLKVLFYIVCWSATRPQFKYYPKQMSKMLHMDVEIIELAIQTLIDRKLLTASKEEGSWVLEIVKEEIDKYIKVPLEKVHDSDVFPMAKEVTWNVEKTHQNGLKCEIDDLSEKDIKAMILRLQASLQEKQEMKKKVVTMEKDDLPW